MLVSGPDIDTPGTDAIPVNMSDTYARAQACSVSPSSGCRERSHIRDGNG
jgi:hypothetical protein